MVDTAQRHGLPIEVVTFPNETKTAVQAAAALGCNVGQIVKSLVFRFGDEFVVVLVPGDRRLDTSKLATAAGGGSKVRRAELDDVRAATGFVAGGTPPFGHVNDLRIFADTGLRRTPTVWAAAGTPHTVFEIAVDDLEHLVNPWWGDLSEQ